MTRRTALLLIACSVTAAAQVVSNNQPPAGPQVTNATPAPPPQAPPSPPNRITIPAGTKILLALQSPITTKSAKPGAPVYAATTFPVTQDGKMLIPAGTYVQGVIDQVVRPGRVKGRAQLKMHFSTLIYPNGYTVALPGTLSDNPGGEHETVKNSEGTVQANGDKGHDAGTVAEATATGAGLGTLVGAATGHLGSGLGIGAAAGAAGGLASVLLSRGPDIRFDTGTPLEMDLQRPLVVEEQRVTGNTNAYLPIQTQRPMQRDERDDRRRPLDPGLGLPFPR
jgi:hypothetical protein